MIKGGGISRFKKHLACKKGDVEPCSKVPQDVAFEMQQNLDSFASKKRKTQEQVEELTQYDHNPILGGNEDDVVEVAKVAKSVGAGGSRSQTSGSLDSFVKKIQPRTTPGAQPTLKSVLQTKQAKEKVDIAVSKWMIDASIPFNAANSMYYQPAIDAMTNFGAGYKGPNFHDLRGFLLTKNVEQVNAFVESYRSVWKETGCTIMADGWSDQNRRTLINFLVYCPKGTIFLKSVDASAFSKTAELLYDLFKEVVKFVGAAHVVQIVTDNASNYVAAGRLLEREFPTLYWSPCAAHCLNLMFNDMGKLEEVNGIVTHASKITKYIYNHCYVLHLMRQHTNGREILRPATTRFATNFIALQSILGQKNALRAMVTSREWTLCAYARESRGRRFVEDVLDSGFWRTCAIVVQLTEPLLRVLRIVDSDDRPAMGYLYDAFLQARAEMVRRFQRRKKVMDPYLQIVDSRWDRQLMKNINLAGYWFNPKNLTPNNEMHRRSTSGLLDVIEKYAYNDRALNQNLTKEMGLFRNGEGDFGRRSANLDRAVMQPGKTNISFVIYLNE